MADHLPQSPTDGLTFYTVLTEPQAAVIWFLNRRPDCHGPETPNKALLAVKALAPRFQRKNIEIMRVPLRNTPEEQWAPWSATQ